ncbi:MAG: DNA-binding protein WhiA [Bacilli bacterium]|nr:DNA-binding protein WhiA [Bacilli bacterium]
MSFTATVKNEISLLEFSRSENIAELSAFLRGNSKISNGLIELTTENAKVAKRLYLMFKSLYGLDLKIEQKKLANFSTKKIYTIEITKRLEEIVNDLSILDKNNEFIENPKEYIIDSQEEKKAYLRGSFLSKGSINDPKTSQYHLEFGFENKHEAVFVQRLLNEFDMNSKIIIRDTKYMVYIKEAEKISDFLKIINAFQAVLYYENIRIYKEQKNNTNRLNNCEQANMDKIIETCNNQLKEIDIIDKEMGLELLDEKLKEACLYRRKYRESSLTELSEIISLETNSKITKSGLNHRFRKIKEIAERLDTNKKKHKA